MTPYRRQVSHKLLASSLTIFLLLVLRRTGLAQDDAVLANGKQEYHSNCATCHGVAAKGDGPMAELLTRKPANLTQLSRKNGGEFPFWKVYHIIDGREEVMAHGVRNMPIWGARFSSEAGEGPGTESSVLGRILGLVYYLQSIQDK
ncbi:MAG: cytochrome c [Deltaproteobacteria bacterium]|nr:cytochrome c [Deltaproteobacteria bacterium]